MQRGRNAQFIRLLGLIRDLSAAPTGVPIQDIRDRYGVTRRTVERDLAAIEAAGFVVETMPAPEPGKVRKRVRSTGPEYAVPVTAAELAAARAAVTALEREAPSTVVASLRMLVNRLEDGQALAVAVDAEGLAEAQAFVPRAGALSVVTPKILDALRDAILRCQTLRVRYRKGGAAPAKDYVAEPYGILYGARGYLVWRGVDDRRWRKFALQDIDNIEPTAETFVRDPSFSIQSFADDSFGVIRDESFDVVLEVVPAGMPRLRNHRFHPSQEVSLRHDGGATVTFTASGLEEVCWHLFSWGDQIEVKAPAELVRVYADSLSRAATSIRTSSASDIAPHG